MRSIIWAFGIIISFLYVGAAAKDRQCPESCDESRCGEQLVKCSSGFYTKDKCGCCNVCLRLRNEQCGGRNDNFGKCAQGLTCVKDNIDVFMNDDEPNEDEEKEEMTGTCQGAQDCILSPWSSWSKCSKQCGFGTMKRRRVVLQLPKNGGKPCPAKHEKKGCFRQNCEGDMVLAQILPAEYRRQPFGSYKFDKILPQKKKLTEIQKIRKRFRSHCVNFKLLSKHPYCEGTWAEKLKMSKPMCVECQPAIMDDQGFCKGEGIAGNFTSWIATNAKTCSGLWMRVGEKIPNCKCIDQKFQNFIFV